MKTFKYLLAGTFLVCYAFSSAQVSVNVNVGIPAWGVPVTTERYYYIPDIETYYDIPSREYIYLNNGLWVRSVSVPTIYRHYDFYRGRKVIINDYRGNAPYAYYNVHRVKYVPARPHRVWVREKYHGHGIGYRHGRGHGRGHGHH